MGGTMHGRVAWGRMAARAILAAGLRPRPGSTQAEYGLWVVERTADGGWSEAKYFGPGMYVSVARNGDLYMTDVGRLTGSGPANAVVQRWTGTQHAPPQRLPGGINSPAGADHSFIAPDDSYILFDSTRPGGQGEGDLYVCFRKPDGTWSEAMNLGDAINTPGTNFCPSVSPDGQYIFYTANRDIYWVSAEILGPLRAKALGPADSAATTIGSTAAARRRGAASIGMRSCSDCRC